jgi:arylsulfatase A
MKTPHLLAIAILVAIGAAIGAEVPSANRQRADGRIVLLATNAIVHGKTIRYEPQPHKNTIGYWTKLEDWVSWDFEVHTPGTFNVTLTQSCGAKSGGSKVVFAIDEQSIQDIVPETGSFTTWTNRSIGVFNLRTAGTYTITVKPQSKPGLAVMDLRAITFVRAR